MAALSVYQVRLGLHMSFPVNALDLHKNTKKCWIFYFQLKCTDIAYGVRVVARRDPTTSRLSVGGVRVCRQRVLGFLVGWIWLVETCFPGVRDGQLARAVVMVVTGGPPWPCLLCVWASIGDVQSWLTAFLSRLCPYLSVSFSDSLCRWRAVRCEIGCVGKDEGSGRRGERDEACGEDEGGPKVPRFIMYFRLSSGVAQ